MLVLTAIVFFTMLPGSQKREMLSATQVSQSNNIILF